MIPAGYQVVIAPRADTDLLKIIGQPAGPLPPDVSPRVRAIFAAFDSLADVPHRTVVAAQPVDRRPPVRSLAVPPYMVFFRVYDGDKVVRVTRVRHGAMRPLRRFD